MDWVVVAFEVNCDFDIFEGRLEVIQTESPGSVRVLIVWPIGAVKGVVIVDFF